MPLHLSDVNGQHKDVDIEPRSDNQSVNYEELEQKLGLEGKQRAYVLNDDGVNVKFTTKTTDATHFIVMERSEVEMEVANTKWKDAEGSPDARAASLLEMYDSTREKSAAINRYQKNITHPENQLFPDYNNILRNAYVNGLKGQTPKEYLHQSNETERIGTLPHEPTIGEVENFKTSQLRWAFTMGLQNNSMNAEHFIPSPMELREAHRQGKEAVAIRLNDSEFQRVDLEFFKMCALPTEYADYQGGKEKKEADNFARRMALRSSFHAGVTDAWNARKANCVTQVKSSDRVSEKPSLRDAFNKGAATAKCVSGVPGARVEISQEGKSFVSGEYEKQYAPEIKALTKGLEAAWESQATGATPPRADQEYPDNTDEEKAAFKMGVAKYREVEKEKEEIKRAAEAEEAKNKPEPTVLEKFCLAPYNDFKTTCCPVVTTDPATSKSLICGTSVGDWGLILLLFLIYYTYLAMWFWAHIEIMFVIAEPQRPH